MTTGNATGNAIEKDAHKLRGRLRKEEWCIKCKAKSIFSPAHSYRLMVLGFVLLYMLLVALFFVCSVLLPSWLFY